MAQKPNGDESTLVRVMAWCRQAASPYLSQCWPRSVTSYGATTSQWIKMLALLATFRHYDSVSWQISSEFKNESDQLVRDVTIPPHSDFFDGKGLVLLTEIDDTIIELRAWVSNYIHTKL